MEVVKIDNATRVYQVGSVETQALRELMEQIEREKQEIRNQVQGEGMFRRGLRANSYVLMTFMQGVVDIPTWMGAYEKAIDGGFDEETAIALADQALHHGEDR